MKRREFLGNCAAALVVPVIPCLPRSEKPMGGGQPQLPTPAARRPRTRRHERYDRYEEMLKDPRVRDLLQRICDGAMKSPYAEEPRRVAADFGYGSAPWRHAFADYWVYAAEMQAKHPLVFAQRIGGVHVWYGEESAPESPMDFRKMKLDRDAFWDFEELTFAYWGLFGTSYKMQEWLMSLATYGDLFLEPIWNPEEPKIGICGTSQLPVRSVYRVETVKGELVEYQQSSDGVDYASIARMKVADCVLHQDPKSEAIRFRPEDLVHCRLPNLMDVFEGKSSRPDCFRPYGTSLVEYLDDNCSLNLETHSCWLVNLLRNSLLNGLTELGKRHLQMKGNEFSFCLL